jgi:5-methylcytosine-specific restriction endonuclease McrA
LDSNSKSHKQSVNIRFKRARGKVGTLYCDVCGWPGDAVSVMDKTKVLHVHHVSPLSDGGDQGRSNLMILCPNHHSLCHMLYGHRTPNIQINDLKKQLMDFESNGPGVDPQAIKSVKRIMDRLLTRSRVT